MSIRYGLFLGSLVHSLSHSRNMYFCVSCVPGTMLHARVSPLSDADVLNVLEEFKKLTAGGASYMKQTIQ